MWSFGSRFVQSPVQAAVLADLDGEVPIRLARQIMSTPRSIPEPAKPQVLWYQHVWLALPFALVAVGGAIGGACGGAAWAINLNVFQKTQHAVLRYVWTGLISAAAVVTYVVLAAVFISLFKKGN
jgi:hypothetical protein